MLKGWREWLSDMMGNGFRRKKLRKGNRRGLNVHDKGNPTDERSKCIAMCALFMEGYLSHYKLVGSTSANEPSAPSSHSPHCLGTPQCSKTLIRP
jgi:hypothetical protein